MRSQTSLVLLPGLLCDSAHWHAQVDDLADIARAQVASYGQLDSIEAMAQAVLSWAPKTFALAGHSMGGRVALEIFKRAPERVARLALFCTDYRGHASEADFRREAAEREKNLAMAREEGMEAFTRQWVRSVIAPSRLDDEELIGAMVAMMARQAMSVLAAQTLAGLRRGDYADLLPRIFCPTLVCAGEEDTLRPVAGHREMAARIPASRLVVIEGSGHMVAMERPQDVSNAMRQWILG